MPTAPPRTCRCGRLVPGGQSCPHCTRVRDKARGTAHHRGYGGAWPEYSKQWLARFPWCGLRVDGQFHAEHSRCVQRGERTRATLTDHIVAIADGGARLDPANHQSLCTSCNVAKSRSAGSHGGRERR